MSDYDELISVLTDLLVNRFAPKPTYVRGLLGDGQGNVVVPERPDKSFVRFNRGSNEFFEAFNRTVNPVHDWPVLIGSLPWQPGLTQVVDTDWSAFEQSGWGDILGSTSPHAPTHEWPDKSPGSDPLNVYLRSIVPMRAYAVGSGTTTVYVNSYEYEYQSSGQVWPGVPGIELSPIISSMVTGTMRFMGIYLDPDTNTLGIVTGSTTVFTSAFDPPSVQFPAGKLPSARIRVYGSQTSIAEADIRDIRQPFHPGTYAFPNGPAGGDLTGSYPNPSVAGLFGSPLVDTSPSEGDLLMFSGSAWRPLSVSLGGNVWPKAGECGISDTQYATWALMIAALGANEQGLVGEGSFTTDHAGGERLVTGADLRGSGIDVSVLTDSDTFVLEAEGVSQIQDITIANTNTDGGSAFLADVGADIECIHVRATSAAIDGTTHGFRFADADGRLMDCEALASGSGTNYALAAYDLGGDSDVEVIGGYYDGDILSWGSGATVKLFGPVITGDLVATNGIFTGWYYDGNDNLIAVDDFGAANAWAFKVKNTAGVTTVLGDIGYIDEAGEYKETTTANDNVAWCVVIKGGADNADIYVTRRGRVTVTLNANCSIGDFLLTSTTAGQASVSSTLRPEIFAVALTANTGGVGGTCEALLLTGRTYVPATFTSPVFQILNSSSTRFLALINSGGVGGLTATNVPYDTVTGNEDSIVPNATTHLSKLVLHNTTRGTYRLITAVNTGTNTITTVNSVDAWANNDNIQVNSLTNLHNRGGTSYYFDLDFSQALSTLPPLVVGFAATGGLRDSAGAGRTAYLHPFDTYSAPTEQLIRTQATQTIYGYWLLGLIDNRITFSLIASGAGTIINFNISIVGLIQATP